MVIANAFAHEKSSAAVWAVPPFGLPEQTHW